jgi:hypothetical protein
MRQVQALNNCLKAAFEELLFLHSHFLNCGSNWVQATTLCGMIKIWFTLLATLRVQVAGAVSYACRQGDNYQVIKCCHLEIVCSRSMKFELFDQTCSKIFIFIQKIV